MICLPPDPGVDPVPGGGNPQPAPGGAPTNITATADNSQLTGGNGAQIYLMVVLIMLHLNIIQQLQINYLMKLSGDTINGGFYRGPTDFNSSNTVGLGPNDMLKFDNNLAISYNGTLFSNFVSNQSISASAGNSFAGGGGLEFGLLNLSGNVIVAFDRDLSGTFNELVI